MFVHSRPREDFTLLSRSEMGTLSIHELTDYNSARKIWNKNPPMVKTPQLTSAFQVLGDAVASLQRDNNRPPSSVVIDAVAGVGKTTIATEFAREFHLQSERTSGITTTDGDQRLPVAFVPVNAGTTLKGLNTKILDFYGHPAAARTRSETTSIVADFAFSCETQLIILDDLHFVDFNRRNGIEVSNHIKSLTREIPAVFVVVGAGLKEKGFFEEGLSGPEMAYSQTSRRFTRCTVSPFTRRSTNTYRAWIELLAIHEAHLKLADSRPGMLVDQAALILKRTTGRLISLAQLIEGVCDLAILTGAETVTEDLIKKVRVDNAAELGGA
jgi:hypothetical protein